MTLEELKKDVVSIHEKIKKECEKNDLLKNKYKGCQIYFSDIVEIPEIMFLGFNPGPGFYNCNKKIVEEFEPDDKLEYLYNDYTLLSKQVRALFKLMDREYLLKKGFKTNVYYFATNNVNEFYSFLNLLSKDLKNEIINNSRIWLIEMINIIKPKNIICEGIEAFNELKCLYKDNFTIDINDIYFKKANINNINVFAFSRFRSIIKKKEIFAENICKYV